MELKHRSNRTLDATIRLVVDSDVSEFSGGPAGLRDARDRARCAIEDGAECVEIYEGSGEQWNLISSLRQKEPRRFFRDAAREIAKGGELRLKLPTREHAAYLLDSVLKAPRGRDEINILSSNLHIGTTRSENIRGVFVVFVSAESTGKVRYRIEAEPHNREALHVILQRAGSEEPERIATTPHHVFRPSGRQRGMSRK